VRRARRDQIVALVAIAGASLRLRFARRRLGVYRRMARWRQRAYRRLRSQVRALAGWLG
jgi:hypothetical protein